MSAAAQTDPALPPGCALRPARETDQAAIRALVRALAAKGAHPYLLVNSEPYTGGEAGDWWRQVAQVSDIVSEDYFVGPKISKLGPILGSRRRAWQ